ncbi:hypothetical protein BC938DRAFT_483319 [Jimgerdemannia flammicorona]|uniref:Uncharacterized protein n=1 Tax=Jimgerdemannia flammicorona TaxID=994334 RepID=A0A433QC58_9FUNG|nr:hypothetical protein BC938DRAFT_483319 [Jimgerdemannia flammicorona]
MLSLTEVARELRNLADRLMRETTSNEERGRVGRKKINLEGTDHLTEQNRGGISASECGSLRKQKLSSRAPLPLPGLI